MPNGVPFNIEQESKFDALQNVMQQIIAKNPDKYDISIKLGGKYTPQEFSDMLIKNFSPDIKRFFDQHDATDLNTLAFEILEKHFKKAKNNIENEKSPSHDVMSGNTGMNKNERIITKFNDFRNIK